MSSIQIRDDHDSSLPAWGPYGKQYIGWSHIPQPGWRFDCSLFPGLHRRRCIPPNVRAENAYHPREAAADGSYVRHRHSIVGRDDCLADIDCCLLDDQASLLRWQVNNRSDCAQRVSMYWLCALAPPPHLPGRLHLPDGGLWIDACTYDTLDGADQAHRRRLVWDGHRFGEVFGDGFVDGCALQLDGGWQAQYHLSTEHDLGDACLVIRHRTPGPGHPGRCTVTIDGCERPLLLHGDDALHLDQLAIGRLSAGRHTIAIRCAGRSRIDGLAILPAAAVGALAVDTSAWHPEPQIAVGPTADSLLLHWDGCPLTYGLRWGDQLPWRLRGFAGRTLDLTIQEAMHRHPPERIPGDGEGFWQGVLQEPIVVAAGERRSGNGLLACGTRDQVLARLETDPAALTAAHERARARRFSIPEPTDERIAAGVERMAATTCTNIVYPVRTRGRFIKHHCPGRWWDCLYTWDSGFIGLGLCELDLQRAADCLHTYLCPPDTHDAAFIHHGSPVPVQIYLAEEIWRRSGDRTWLAQVFPMLCSYHAYLVGRHPGSNCRMASGMIRTYDLFYNAGGWDDYPAQSATHQRGLSRRCAPVVNTAHAIRCARILRAMARLLGADTTPFDDDIASCTAVLQEQSWNAEEGCYSHLLHDDHGQVVERLRHESGADYNRGHDGCSPLVSGICTPEQDDALCELLLGDGRCRSPIGLCAVDRSAPYYDANGYWNGTVWMPHQWFFWRALLGMGRLADAHWIADTALALWGREVAASDQCYEHFVIDGGRGAGWHHFSGLSAPVLNWHAAYQTPGTCTPGFGVWVDRLSWSDDQRSCCIEVDVETPAHHRPTIMVVLAGDAPATALVDGQPLALQRHQRAWCLSLPGQGRQRIEVQNR